MDPALDDLRRAMPSSRSRALVAAVTVVAMIMALPGAAHAQEMAGPETSPAPASEGPSIEGPSVMTQLVPVLPLDVSRATLLAPASTSAPSSLALFTPAARDIRLSHGAKVAIIVTAIVVGSLIVLGVFVASRPGHHL